MEQVNQQNENTAVVPRQLRGFAIGGGKGGVGKTMISVGVATALVERSFRVLLFDADLGLANVDLHLGVDPDFTLQDVVYGNCSLGRAVYSVPGGPDILAASSGAQEMVTMGAARRELLVDELIRFAAGYDYLIIDTEAGIGPGAIAFLKAMPLVNIVVANEPTSIMDAYSLIKILADGKPTPEIRLVLNMVKSIEDGQELARRLNTISAKFLGRRLDVAGIILQDPVVGDAIRARRSVVKYAPNSAPACGLQDLAQHLVAAGRLREHGQPINRELFSSLTTLSVDGQIAGEAV
jgi:flagellar biosynthesis protein FlhG